MLSWGAKNIFHHRMSTQLEDLEMQTNQFMELKIQDISKYFEHSEVSTKEPSSFYQSSTTVKAEEASQPFGRRSNMPSSSWQTYVPTEVFSCALVPATASRDLCNERYSFLSLFCPSAIPPISSKGHRFLGPNDSQVDRSEFQVLCPCWQSHTYTHTQSTHGQREDCM